MNCLIRCHCRARGWRHPRASGTARALSWSASALLFVFPPGVARAQVDTGSRAADHPLSFINTSIENGSPLYWEIGDQGEVNIFLVYDQQRSSPNRANGHWHFQLQATAGCDLTLILHNFDNVWNGQHGSPLNDEVTSFLSPDGKSWQRTATQLLDGNRLKIQVHMDGDAVYVARLEPYRLSDLEHLKESLAGNPLVEITPIGRTVEGRELEMIRVGHPDAAHRVLLRARAHPWEPGGNWVIEGIIRRLLRDDALARDYLDRYCVYAMPIANKDGVARGRTRFNALGCDLNRQWDRPADSHLAPENHALEQWLGKMVAAGKKPDLAIDFHNDNSGNLHVSRPNIDLDEYLARMQRFEELLRKDSWFTEGATGGSFRNPGTFGEGLLERFNVVACIHELNANRIAGLDDFATARNWQLYGEQLCQVFHDYFGP